MLVLSRREKSKIVLPDLGIEIKVLKISGSQVKIGIDAPDDIKVVRGELCGELRGEMKAAQTQARNSLVLDGGSKRKPEQLGESRIGYRVNHKSRTAINTQLPA